MRVLLGCAAVGFPFFQALGKHLHHAVRSRGGKPEVGQIPFQLLLPFPSRVQIALETACGCLDSGFFLVGSRLGFLCERICLPCQLPGIPQVLLKLVDPALPLLVLALRVLVGLLGLPHLGFQLFDLPVCIREALLQRQESCCGSLALVLHAVELLIRVSPGLIL